MIELSSIEFDCRVTTPMFLGGAEPNMRPELRAQTIKGLLRWHWRALQDPSMPLDQLREKEGELFGIAADSAEKSKKSDVSIQVRNELDLKTLKYKDGPDSGFRGKQNVHDRNYLSYFLGADPNNKAYFPVGTTFQVVFTCMPDRGEQLVRFADLFVLLSALGGFGSRTSRVMGGFQIDDARTSNVDWDVDKIADYPDQVIRDMVTSPGVILPASYENHTRSSFLLVESGYSDLNAALDFVGRQLKRIRKDNKELRDIGFFGLPVKADKRSGPEKTKVTRQTSPLRIRLSVDEDVQYMILFQMHWLEGNGFTKEVYYKVFMDLKKYVQEELNANEIGNTIFVRLA
jgi:CRISPR type III-B/RAMP module RAMP protein Cmr1